MTSRPTTDHRTNDQFQVLSEAECLALLTTGTVGRVAFLVDEEIHLIPLNYALVDGELYFRTDSRSVLHALAEGREDVAFGIDYHDDVSPTGWNVTVKGATRRVEDTHLHARVMATPRLRPWAGGTRSEVIHLFRRSIEGRRVLRV